MCNPRKRRRNPFRWEKYYRELKQEENSEGKKKRRKRKK